MNMKKILTLMLLATIATTSYGQEANTKISQLENYLQELGFGVSHTQSNAFERGITHQWRSFLNVMPLHPPFNDNNLSEAQLQRIILTYDSINTHRRQQMESALDSIRLTFAILGKDGSESYLYEYHKDGTDTIKYSLAFRQEADSLYSTRYGNQVYFHNAREVANFDYHKNYKERNIDHMQGAAVDEDGNLTINGKKVKKILIDGKEFKGDVNGFFNDFEEFGNYSHLYTIPTNLTWDEMQPFDVAAFESLILPVLKKAKKLKGVKTYPIYWRHDEGYDDNVSNGGLVSKTTRQSDYGDNKHTGLTTGTHYFIPAQYKAEAEALHQQLDSIALDYVNRHPEQEYIYNYSSRIPYANLHNIVEGMNIKGDSNYHLSCMMDQDGYHIIIITTKGELWIPNDWPKLKSYINGEKVYRKE